MTHNYEMPTTKEGLMNILKEIFTFYRVKRPEYEPPVFNDLELDYLEPENLTAQELTEKATALLQDKHAREIFERKEKLNEKIEEIELQVNSIDYSYEKEIEELEEKYGELISETKKNAGKNGIINSDIVLDKINALKGKLSYLKAEISAKKNRQENYLNSKLTALRAELLNVNTYFADVHTADVNVKALELKDLQDKKNAEIEKYNSELSEREQKYANTLERSRQNLVLEHLDIESKDLSKDQLVNSGYYEEVMFYTLGYYDTLSPSIAYNDIGSEGRLIFYLEDYYGEVLYLYKVKSNS